MNLLEVLHSPPLHAAPAAWRGTWARLWLQPSIFSAQRFLVGLAMLDQRGLCDFRLISGTDKFEFVYGEAGRTLVDQLIAEIRQTLAAAREQHAPLNGLALPYCLHIDPVGFASDLSAQHALEAALTEAEIPMEPQPELAKAPRFKSRPADQVVQDLFKAVKQRMGMKADAILREDHFGDEKHIGMVNLVQPHGAGILASGWYADSQRVQLELLKSANLVESYMRHNKKQGQPAVFLLRPTTENGLNPKQSLEIENALDQLDYHLTSKGLRVTTRNFESDIADDVAEWVKS